MPWDREQCTHSAGVKCSGTIGCQVDEREAALWHDDLAQRWNWFVTDLRRTLDLDVQFMKTYEPQERGALHAHAMMRVVDGVVSDERFRVAVREWCREAGLRASDGLVDG